MCNIIISIYTEREGKREIYYKELTHLIMEAKSLVRTN